MFKLTSSTATTDYTTYGKFLFTRSGNIAQITSASSKLSSLFTAPVGTRVLVGTVPPGFSPHHYTPFTVICNDVLPSDFVINIDIEGDKIWMVYLGDPATMYDYYFRFSYTYMIYRY